MNPIGIGGLSRLSSCDWPGKLVATVFCQGCPWRCSYCHNPHLQDPAGADPLPWREVEAFLTRRRGLLDGVVFSGGEPTLQPDLEEAIARTRAMGFAIGLHSGGAFPDRLAALLPGLDWIGLDIKAPAPSCDALTGIAGSGARARASLGHVLAARVAYEVRTTIHPDWLSPDAVLALVDELQDLGVDHYALQIARVGGRIPDPAYPFQGPAGAALRERLKKFASFDLRD